MVSKAFIFGSNYKGTTSALNACVRDCERINEALLAKGYQITAKWSEDPLLKTEIHTALTNFLTSLKSGDKAIIYYSGHGFQLPDTNRDETDGKDEYIYLSGTSYVSDDEFRALLQTVPIGVNLLLIFDCCHSGTILDLPYQYDQFSVKRESKFNFKANITCISGCADPNVSYEADGTGFLTDCLLGVLQNYKPTFIRSLPWVDFYLRISSRLLDKSNMAQFAQLTCSQPNVLRSFWL